MASKTPNTFLGGVLSAYIAAKDLRARLVMTDTTCDTEIDAITNLSDYSDIDASDATGYVDIELTGETVTVNDTDNRGDLDTSAAIVFPGLSGDATRDYQGVLIYEYVDGTDANDIPMFYVDFTSTLVKEATQVTVPSSTTNLLQATQG